MQCGLVWSQLGKLTSYLSKWKIPMSDDLFPAVTVCRIVPVWPVAGVEQRKCRGPEYTARHTCASSRSSDLPRNPQLHDTLHSFPVHLSCGRITSQPLSLNFWPYQTVLLYFDTLCWVKDWIACIFSNHVACITIIMAKWKVSKTSRKISGLN